MSTFTWTPSYSSRRIHKPQVRIQRNGDGYAQIAQDGINPVVRTYELVFNSLTDADADAIESFLATNVGLSFDWTAPGELSSTRWVCIEDWTRTHVNYNVNKMEFSLEQQGVYVPKQYGIDMLPLLVAGEWVNQSGGSTASVPSGVALSLPHSGASQVTYLKVPIPPTGNWKFSPTFLGTQHGYPSQPGNYTGVPRIWMGAGLLCSTSGAIARRWNGNRVYAYNDGLELFGATEYALPILNRNEPTTVWPTFTSEIILDRSNSVLTLSDSLSSTATRTVGMDALGANPDYLIVGIYRIGHPSYWNPDGTLTTTVTSLQATPL